MIKRLCVYCGSQAGVRPEYTQAAQQLGRALVERNIGLVYGGAKVGLMGSLAETMLADGGEVIGVFPLNLWSKEENHPGLTMTHIVSTLHERKAKMAELADGFIALPGGLGTFDELMEIVEWNHLGLLQGKPIGLLNVAAYFTPFLYLMEQAVKEGFLSQCPSLYVTEQASTLVDVLMMVSPQNEAHYQSKRAPVRVSGYSRSLSVSITEEKEGARNR